MMLARFFLLSFVVGLWAFQTDYVDHFESTTQAETGIQFDVAYTFPDSGYIRLGSCQEQSSSHYTIDVTADLETPPLKTLLVRNADTVNEKVEKYTLTEKRTIRYHRSIAIPPQVLHVDPDPVIVYAVEGSHDQRLGRCSQTSETIYGVYDELANSTLQQGMTSPHGARNANKPGWWYKWHPGNKNHFNGGWYCDCHDNSGKHLLRCNPNGKILPQQHGFFWKTHGHGRSAETEISREIMALKGEHPSVKDVYEMELPDDLLEAEIYVGFDESDVDVNVARSIEERDNGPGPWGRNKWNGWWYGGGKLQCTGHREPNPTKINP